MLATLLLTLATTVTLQRDGVPVDGGEVCRFAAADAENPFQRWLSSPDVVCVPAGSPVDFPKGLWNVFGRTAAGLLATPLLVDGERAPHSLSLTLDTASSIAVLLTPEQRAVIYAQRRGVAIPVVGERVTVPAKEPLWLFVLEKSVPVKVLPVGAIEPGAERSVDARGDAPAAVIGWLRVPEEDRAAIAEARGLAVPSIRATGSETREADPLPPFDRLHGAFIRIAAVPPGEADLSAGGRGWVPQRKRLRVQPGLTLAADPLTLRAAGTLIVNWTADRDVPRLEQSLGSCQPRQPPQYEVTVSACPPPQRGEAVDPANCSVIRQEVFDADLTFGGVTLDDIVPGLYRSELRCGILPPVSALTAVPAAQVRKAPLYATYIELYGSVTRGGEPVEEAVAIDFPGGYGFAPRGSGEYRAALLRLLGTDAPITVAACDGAPRAVVLVDQPMRRSTRFDIDIPGNEIVVAVVDTFTREPLSGATVRYVAMSKSKRPSRVVLTRTVTTDSNGKVVIAAVPERDLHVSAGHGGYEKKSIPPFSLWKDEKRTIDVDLVPLRGYTGKIISSRPFESGAVFWYSEGREIERAELGADGTFVYGRSHEPDETMIVVSLSHPLWVFRAPKLERRQTIHLRFPDVMPRTIDVWVKGADRTDNRHAGMVIGELVVADAVLRQHQFLRGESAIVRGNGPLRFRDLADTAPIDILLGSLTTDRSTDPFEDALRQRVAPGANAVTFELK